MEQGDYACSDDDNTISNDLGLRLRSGIDLGDLRDGKGVEFNIDEETLPKPDTQPDETCSYFEHGEVYKNSELHTLGEDDSSDEESDQVSFERLRQRMTPITKDEGVVKRILRPGMGPAIEDFVKALQEKEMEKPEKERRPLSEEDIQVAYHYSASQEGESEPYDVTYLRDQRPQKAFLNDEFFPGFKLALCSMKEKEVADFLISPEYAFGKLGCAPRIKPNATLRYKIELVKYWATTELDTYAKMSREEKRSVPVSKLVKLCSRQRENANKLYENGDFKGANHLYGKAIRILEDANLQDDKDEEDQRRSLLKLYLNRSICALKLSRWDQAITFCNKALDIEPRNAKALYRKAKAKMEFGDFAESKRIAQMAHKVYPNDQGIGKLLADIDSREAREKKREKLLCQKMFGNTEYTKAERSPFSKELLQILRQFKESVLQELKLTATTYTAAELDALCHVAASMQLTVLPNKERNEWISLRLRKD
ncbi:inactive peptidyl-prolyl cis-trans isomerase FKBP6-like isoform X2 [Watersipora subatra]|uniref:inactive peptidyl-prolyl cis-trans isomerase FKBP6-like isoform X2 n=1 Tax=Watersipora subatra TaxID=2589382 RepID=UPI00355B2B24